MIEVIKGFFSTKGFMPHGMCLFWKPSVLWTLVLSNGLIALSYLLIPTILLTVYLKRKDIQYTWLFLLFAAFILLCGTTHALHIVTYWKPIYGMQGLVDALTGIVSFTTAIVLWKLTPELLSIPTPEAYRISQEKYKKFVESVHHGICTFGDDFKISFINSMGADILDQLEAQLLGRDVRKVFSLDDFKLPVATEKMHFQGVIYTAKKQKVLDYYITQLSKSAEGEQFLLSFNDITIFRDISNWDSVMGTLEKTQLTQARLLESQKLESLGQLAGGIAHDINNTLAIITGSLEIAHDLVQKEDDALHHQLDTADKAAKSSAELIKQLLMFSRNKETQHPTQALNLKYLLEKVALFNKTILSSTTTCTIQEEEDLWKIKANENQLLQLFTNLMTNARDAMPDTGGDIHITAENTMFDAHALSAHQVQKPGPYVKITVSDTGIGIPQDNLKNVFTPFFSTKPAGQGTGLGLSVVYGVVLNHHGEVFVDSKVGQGTTFTFFFPKTSEETNEHPANAALGSAPNETDVLQHQSILVADDEEALREIISTHFLSCGAKVLSAKDGLEAVTTFKQHQHELALIVLDSTMPKLDGVSAYQKIRAISDLVPVLFISGDNADAKLPEVVKGDKNATWLSKPFGKLDLLHTAQHLVSTFLKQKKAN
ncbi:MAG: ATP-binding protein [Legionellaceae bacterium]|nr:ATP-binding protein [Legionellaceae bacterium]